MSDNPAVDVVGDVSPAVESTSTALVPVEVHTTSPAFVPLPERFGPQSDLVECFESSYLVLKLQGATASTISRYYLEFRRLTRYLGRDPIVGDFRDEMISRLMADMTDKGSAPATVNKFLTTWKAFENFAARKGLCDSIELRRVREVTKTPSAWTTAEVERLVDACDSSVILDNGINEGALLRALILALYCTAERITAMLSARWADLSGDLIIIRAEHRKGGRADMAHKLSAEALAAVEAIAKPERAFIFDLSCAGQPATMSYRLGRRE